MLSGVPTEVQILGVYFPPLFVAMMVGLLCAVLVKGFLNRTGLSRYFWHPPLASAALWLLATALTCYFIITP